MQHKRVRGAALQDAVAEVQRGPVPRPGATLAVPRPAGHQARLSRVAGVQCGALAPRNLRLHGAHAGTVHDHDAVFGRVADVAPGGQEIGAGALLHVRMDGFTLVIKSTALQFAYAKVVHPT